MIIKVYADESGAHAGPNYLMLSGYIGALGKWIALDAFERPGSTAVQSVRCDPPDRRMSCSLVRQPPRSGQASGHAFAAAPRRHREALRGAEL
jgi:hypothetical protein